MTRVFASPIAAAAILCAGVSLCVGCHREPRRQAVAIEFSRIPQADPGGRETQDIIEGIVKGAQPGQQIVLYAKSGRWWVQPLVTHPFTKLDGKSGMKWTNATHLPLELQPKLLRVLQEQEFERLGSTHTTRVDVRIVAATNLDLPQMVRERRFRADLFYRLNVFPIDLPPLRARAEDIPLLVDHFIRKLALRMNREGWQVAKEVMETLQQDNWPGNIRQLQNVIERAAIMSPGAELRLPPVEGTRLSAGEAASQVRTLAEAERAHILETLRQVNWVIAGRNGAASRLGLARTTLIYRMRKLGIKAENIHSIGKAVDGPTQAANHRGPFVPQSAFSTAAATAGSEL